MNQQKLEALVNAYADGQLNPEQEYFVRSRLDANPELERMYQDITKLKGFLADAQPGFQGFVCRP